MCVLLHSRLEETIDSRTRTERATVEGPKGHRAAPRRKRPEFASQIERLTTQNDCCAARHTRTKFCFLSIITNCIVFLYKYTYTHKKKATNFGLHQNRSTIVYIYFEEDRTQRAFKNKDLTTIYKNKDICMLNNQSHIYTYMFSKQANIFIDE